MPKVEQPTDEQIKEFWEGCGLNKRGGYWWYDQQGKHLTADKPPVIDLNNLFKYAVPIAYIRLFTGGMGCRSAYETLFHDWLEKFFEGYSFEDALFWVLSEVIHGTAK